MLTKLLVTVSGDRSSAYMAIRLHREYKDRDDCAEECGTVIV